MITARLASLEYKSLAHLRNSRSDEDEQNISEKIETGEENDEGQDLEYDDVYGTFLWHWQNVYEDYMQRGITQVEDRIPALAGVTERYQLLTGQTYNAGLWNKNIERQLLWKTTDATLATLSPGRAPSWSWLKVDGEVFVVTPLLKIVTVSRVLSIETTPANSQYPFGAIRNGLVRIDAVILPVEERWIATGNVPVEWEGISVDFDVWDPGYDLKQCFLCPLTLEITSSVGGVLRPELRGLLLVLASMQLNSNGQRTFQRAGIFSANDAIVCQILRHGVCLGQGCDYTDLNDGEVKPSTIDASIIKVSQDRGVQITQQPNIKGARGKRREMVVSFLNDGCKRETISIC